jgi:hypothetical protein
VDGLFEGKANKASAGDGSIYGLVFGLNSKTAFSQFYVFWVDANDGTYFLQRYQSGSWTNLTTVGASAAIARDAAENRLKVRRDAELIHLYVNDVFLTTVTDNSFPTNGFFGVANWAYYSAVSAIAYFDDFKVNAPTLILADNFSNPNSGWPVGVAGACQASYSGGEYVTATQAGYSCVYRAPGGRLPSGLFEATARRQESVYPSAYGLMFGEDGSFSLLYVFWVNPDSQEYVLARWDGTWAALTWDEEHNDAWTDSPAINPGTGSNQLRVKQDGGLISLWVNNQFLESVAVTSFPGGRFGVANWASNYAPGISYFDDFRVTAWEAPTVSAQAAELPGGRPPPQPPPPPHPPGRPPQTPEGAPPPPGGGGGGGAAGRRGGVGGGGGPRACGCGRPICRGPDSHNADRPRPGAWAFSRAPAASIVTPARSPLRSAPARTPRGSPAAGRSSRWRGSPPRVRLRPTGRGAGLPRRS